MLYHMSLSPDTEETDRNPSQNDDGIKLKFYFFVTEYYN